MKIFSWVIDCYTDVDKESTERLINSIKKYNTPLRLIEYKPFMNYKDIQEQLPDSKNIISYGTINFISKIQKLNLNPGSFCNFAALRYNAYAPHLKNLILNYPYYIVSWGDFLKDQQFYYLTKAEINAMFVRPNSSKKIFDGTVAYQESYMKDFGIQLELSGDKNTKIVISTPKNILEEWRFFVCKGEVITGSRVYKDGVLNIDDNVDPNAWSLALKASYYYQPDPIFVIDICKTLKGYYVVELNAFSCSGIYACDTDKIVKKVNQIIKDI